MNSGHCGIVAWRRARNADDGRPVATALAAIRIVSESPGASEGARHRTVWVPAEASTRHCPRVAVTERIRSRAPRRTSLTSAGLRISLPVFRSTIVAATRRPRTALLGTTDLVIATRVTGTIWSVRHSGRSAVAIATRASPSSRLTLQVTDLEMGTPRTAKAASTKPGAKVSGCPWPSGPGSMEFRSPMGTLNGWDFSLK